MTDSDRFFYAINYLVPTALFTFWASIDGDHGLPDVQVLGDFYIVWNSKNVDPIPTLEEINAVDDTIINCLQFQISGTPLITDYLDQVAFQKQYNSAVTCTTYLTSSVPEWQADAAEFIAWRDSVFNYILEQTTLMQQGVRSVPTFEAFKQELPIMIWPN